MTKCYDDPHKPGATTMQVRCPACDHVFERVHNPGLGRVKITLELLMDVNEDPDLASLESIIQSGEYLNTQLGEAWLNATVEEME